MNAWTKSLSRCVSSEFIEKNELLLSDERHFTRVCKSMIYDLSIKWEKIEKKKRVLKSRVVLITIDESESMFSPFIIGVFIKIIPQAWDFSFSPCVILHLHLQIFSLFCSTSVQNKKITVILQRISIVSHAIAFNRQTNFVCSAINLIFCFYFSTFSQCQIEEMLSPLFIYCNIKTNHHLSKTKHFQRILPMNPACAMRSHWTIHIPFVVIHFEMNWEFQTTLSRCSEWLQLLLYAPRSVHLFQSNFEVFENKKTGKLQGKNKNCWKMNSSVIKTERSLDKAHFCVKCDKQIQDRYFLKALNAFWHENCLKCGCCDCRLADVGSTLFTRENVILCKSDYIRWECHYLSNNLQIQISKNWISNNFFNFFSLFLLLLILFGWYSDYTVIPVCVQRAIN